MSAIAEKMKPFRQRIDDLDDRIIDLLAQRTDIIREVAQFKYDEDIPAVLQDRVDEVRERAATAAAARNVDEDTVRAMYRILIRYSCDLETEIMTALASNPVKAAGGR